MGENFQVLALPSKLQYSLATVIIYLKSFLNWIIKIHRCRTIDNDVALILYQVSIGWGNAKFVGNEVSTYWYDLGLRKL